jgi:hypothetical protein
MLRLRATTKTTDGTNRVKPAVRASATAHTDSSTPDRTRISQAMARTTFDTVVFASRVRHALVRDHRSCGISPKDSRRRPVSRRADGGAG